MDYAQWDELLQRLDALADRLDRILAVYEMSVLTDEQRYHLRVERGELPPLAPGEVRQMR